MNTRSLTLGVVTALSILLIPVSAASSYLVRSLTAIAAAVLLVRFATGLRLTARVLLGGALLVGIASGVVATVQLALTGHPSAPGGPADWTYLSYGPLAVAGLLALPRPLPDGPWRAKALSEAAIAVTSLAFVLAPVVENLARTSGQSTAAKAAALGYPLNAVFVLTVLLVTVPRVPTDLRPFVWTVGLGFALMTVGDIG